MTRHGLGPSDARISATAPRRELSATRRSKRNTQGSDSAVAMVPTLVRLLILIGATLAPARAIFANPTQHMEQSVSSLTPEALADYVPSLPGYGKLDFAVFSGHITVDETAGRALYYVLAEPVHSASAPLILWMNGGPGCSSLGGGFMSELGPVYPTKSDKLQRNKNAWTDVANIVFLDSPAFVGFSYSNTSSDAVVGDKRTAQDAYLFVEGFLQRFPGYKGRPLWLAGESYAGHYVPNLALELLSHRDLWVNAGINFVGLLVGDPLTDPEIDSRGAVEFWHSHAIISDEARTDLLTCNFSGVGPLNAVPDWQAAPEGAQACLRGLGSLAREFSQINIYDIYVDFCLRGQQPSAQRLAQASGYDPRLLGPWAAAMGAAARADGIPEYDPCIDLEVATYVNRPEVQAALHVNASGELPGPWADCNPLVKYHRQDIFESMLPQWHALLQTDLRMLVYSGDVDGILPTTGTRNWVAGLGLPIEEPWRPWHSHTGQVGGHVIQYKGLTFATVRNAGHMVPYTQAERSVSMFSR